MEVLKDNKDFEKLIEKRQKKIEKRELTDFDKVLKGIMSVPKPKDDKEEKEQ